MSVRNLVPILLIIQIFAASSVAQLAFDRTFSQDGYLLANPHTGSAERGLVAEIKRLTDGSYLIAGSAEGVTPGRLVMTVQKLRPDGSIDTSFGGGDGTFALLRNDLGSAAHGMEIQNDGKIVVVGYSFQESQFRFNIRRETVVRLNPDGSLDSTFGTNGATVIPLPQQNNFDNGNEAFDVVVLQNGDIVTGGQYRLGSQNQDPCRDASGRCSTLNFYGPDGTPLGTNLMNIGSDGQHREAITELLLMPDQRILGTIASSFSVIMFNPNGTVDSTFGTNGLLRVPDFFGRTSLTATGLALDSNSKILVSGRTTNINQANGLVTVRLTTNGSLDPTYGEGGKTRVADTATGRSVAGADILVEPNGKILSVGKQGTLVRYREDGTLDQTFGQAGVLTIPGLKRPFTLSQDPDGTIAYAARTTLLEPGSGPVDEWFVGKLRPSGNRFDFDGDRKTDTSIFRPTGGEWWLLDSRDGQNRAFQFGDTNDIPASADFTGDGKTDIALFRQATGEWYVLRSEDSAFYSFPFGTGNDIPAPGDFDGDGVADAAVFRPASGTWFILKSTGGVDIVPFGVQGDMPVVEDYDNDGKDDVAIYRPTNSQWWINRSSEGLLVAQFGSTGDKTVPADYTGDGRADIAIYRPSTGSWFVLQSEDFGFYAFPFGAASDLPAPGDFDGDGIADPAVFRPETGNWFVLGSTSGVSISRFGQNGDRPLPGIYVRE